MLGFNLAQYLRHRLHTTQQGMGLLVEFFQIGTDGIVRTITSTPHPQQVQQTSSTRVETDGQIKSNFGLPVRLGENLLSTSQATGRAGAVGFNLQLQSGKETYTCIPNAFRLLSSNPQLLASPNVAVSGKVERENESLNLDNAPGNLTLLKGEDLAAASWRLISAQSFPDSQTAFQFIVYPALTRWRATGYVRHRNQLFNLTSAWTSLNSIEVKATGEMRLRLRYYYITITLPNKRFHIDAWGDNTQYTTLYDGENGRIISTLRGHCQLSALKKDRSKGLWFFEEMTNTYHTVLLENKYSVKEVAAEQAHT